MVTSSGCRGVTPLGTAEGAPCRGRFTSTHQHSMNVDTERYVQKIHIYFFVIIIPFDVSFFLTIISMFQQYEQLFLNESSTNLVALNDLF